MTNYFHAIQLPAQSLRDWFEVTRPVDEMESFIELVGTPLSKARHRPLDHENCPEASNPPLSVNLPPCAISEHWSDTPRRAEDIERLGEAVIVNQARVDGEDAHKENQIASMEEGVPDLAQGDREDDH